ncbi:MAG: hypothetical protein NC097_03955 [Clostridium sp.]|nr:hypothetical protein [Prevotella sp.]MCM1378136.1 hypothetical protein [Prevotella sp.]MCM1428930.1 hypothetical protein [Clostridium sp.]MCM1475964.1 hypothetical protein [Muribaculaceae bacterium]
MKNFKSLFIAFAMILGFSLAFPTMAGAMPEPQSFTLEQKKLVIAEMNKSLPQTVQDGMVFQKAAINSTGSLLTCTFKIDPMKFGGVTVKDFKAEINKMSNSEIRKLVGSDFIDVLNSIGLNGRFIFVYPDGTQSTININR